MRKAALVALTALSFGANTAVGAHYEVPHLADGAPDFQGYWTNITATPMERDPKLGMRRAYTEAEARAIQKTADDRVAADAKPADPNEQQEAGALPPVGNYNLFWTERGDLPVLIDGEYRTSMVIDPPNGRVPAFNKDAMERRRVRLGARGGMSDGPEGRSLGERCILSFGS